MRDGLPAGWANATLAQVARINPPGASTVVPDDQPVTFLPMAAVEELTGRISTAISKPFGELKKGFTRFRDGDVLFAKITPCMENGKITVARGLLGSVGCGSTEFHVLRPREVLDADYLRYFLVRSTYRREAQLNMQGAVGQQRVPPDFLRASSIPLPPPAEQRRIVSRIEELFSEIDEGERALERVQKLVERYRQSILKAAVTGELTKLRTTETGLPRGWELRSLADLCSEKPCNGISIKGTDSPPGVAALRLDAMTETEFDFSARRFIPITAVKANRLAIRAGDFFVSRANGSMQLVGRGVLASQPPGLTVFPDTMIRYRLGKSEALQRWVAMAWASGLVRRQIEVKAKTTAGIYKISQSDIAEISFPVPPTEAEMLRIAEAVAMQAGAWRRLVQELSHRTRQSSALRQSVLKAAFSGQLVPQDPTDEPASALLARLAKQSVDTPATLRRRARRHRSKSVAA
jgi:type I restriction enzyme S subunit